MTSRRASLSLRGRALAVLAATALVPALVIGVLAVVRARDAVEREVARGSLAHIRALGAALDGTLQDSRRTVELAAASWADAPDDARATELLLRRLRREVPIVRTLSIVDADGALKYGDPLPAHIDSGTNSFGGYIGDAAFVDGRPVVRMVVQARGRTGELIGSFVCALDLGFVHDAIAAARLEPGARLIVVDGAGVPVANSDAAAPVTPGAAPSLAGVDPAVDRALASPVEGTLTANGWVSAYRNLSSYQTLRGVRWAILHEQPEAQAYALADRAARDTAIVGGVALAVALVLGAFVAARLTRPLTELAQRADAIARGGDVDGDAGVSIVKGPGEIGVLAERVDEMTKRIAERAELQAALARGDRLASVGVMSAQVAHEINNPLTTVLGYAKLLLEDKPPEHPDRAAIEMIADEADRMKKIVGGLLEYARAPRASQPALTASATGATGAYSSDPSAVARHVGALLEPQLRKARVALRADITTASEVAIEAPALQQVLVNLVQNSIQAIASASGGGGGGAIEIATRAAPGGIATILTVTDDGPGVPAADRARVFDPLFTTKAAGVGTGLGLAVCKHLITTAGGSIEVGENPSGRGAEFRLMLPNAEVAAAR